MGWNLFSNPSNVHFLFQYQVSAYNISGCVLIVRYTVKLETYSLIRKYRRPRKIHKMIITVGQFVLYSQAESITFVPQARGIIPWSHLHSSSGKASHSSIHPGRIPWTGEPGGLQYMGSQRVGHDLASNAFTSQYIYQLIIPDAQCQQSFRIITELTEGLPWWSTS